MGGAPRVTDAVRTKSFFKVKTHGSSDINAPKRVKRWAGDDFTRVTGGGWTLAASNNSALFYKLFFPVKEPNQRQISQREKGDRGPDQYHLYYIRIFSVTSSFEGHSIRRFYLEFLLNTIF